MSVPATHHEFWNGFTVEKLFALYTALNATSQQVLAMTKEPEAMSPDKARAFSYLSSFIVNLNQDEPCGFLRFVTGSSVLMAKEMSITLNRLPGLACRPISHTCSCTLELPTSYLTYLEFSQEFQRVVSSDMA